MFNPDPKKPKKKKRHRKEYGQKYTDWLKTQPCSNPNCNNPIDCCIPAHQRILGNGGTGIKPPDRDALPLCYWCHTDEHLGPVSFWGQKTKPKTKIFVQNICYEHMGRYTCFLCSKM